eukprot:6831369-Prymnesium_polylepis.2
MAIRTREKLAPFGLEPGRQHATGRACGGSTGRAGRVQRARAGQSEQQDLGRHHFFGNFSTISHEGCHPSKTHQDLRYIM